MSAGAGIPLIDVSPLAAPGSGAAASSARAAVAEALGRACRESGFFYVMGHGVDPALQARLEALSRRFFARPLEEKLSIRMELGGRAWRGYFPPGGELTSGRPDAKEGVYFGRELPPDDPRVRAGVPLHGPNLFPPLPGFRETVLAYLDALTALGHRLLGGIALSLGLRESYFSEGTTRDPLVLFRIFNYPASFVAPDGAPAWGVGEHTDYGVLTILRQDDSGGLQVRSGGAWIDAPPLANTFVCNIGDMLERMTAGRYRSTPHRVRNESGHDRLSFPFFFDPGWDVRVGPVPGCAPVEPGGAPERWDGESVHAFEGTYGDYVLSKIAKVFPQLRDAVL